jgi:hypothetical protein
MRNIAAHMSPMSRQANITAAAGGAVAPSGRQTEIKTQSIWIFPSGLQIIPVCPCLVIGNP